MKKTTQLLILVVSAIALSTAGNVHAATKDDPLLSMVLVDQLEQDISNGDDPLSWSAQAWLGYDLNKLWLKTEGEQSDGKTSDAEVQLVYSRALALFWSSPTGHFSKGTFKINWRLIKVS